MAKAILRFSAFLLCILAGLFSVWFNRVLRRAELSSTKPQANAISTIADEREAVYQSLLEHDFAQDGAELLVIEDVTTGYPMYEDPNVRDEFGEGTKSFGETVKTLNADTATIENYLELNKTPEKLSIHSRGGSHYAFVTEKELADVLGESGLDIAWTKFYARYPKSSGLIFLSKIGFNSDHTQAMLYAGRHCGGLCGGGSYVLLNKKNGIWVVEGNLGLWES